MPRTLAQRCYIYIPLCFYFILHESSDGSGTLYLHSTMLLLYRKQRLKQKSVQLEIYIPLCFYFIMIESYTLILSSGFTFHYASTLSGRKDRSNDGYTDLHSTMLLLYPQRNYVHLLYYSIYIPLCFYFIRVKFFTLPADIDLHSTMLLLYPDWLKLTRLS